MAEPLTLTRKNAIVLPKSNKIVLRLKTLTKKVKESFRNIVCANYNSQPVLFKLCFYQM